MIYKLYPNDSVKEKQPIRTWCENNFVDGTWSVTSNYEERDYDQCPFLFCTENEQDAVLFALRWS